MNIILANTHVSRFSKPCDFLPPQDKFLEVDLLDQKICKLQIKSFHMPCQVASSGSVLVLIYCFSVISNVSHEHIPSLAHFL